MKELETTKNLLLDILANQGGQASKTSINALNALKIEQDIKAPIIINQSISVLNLNIQQRIVDAIKMIDRTRESKDDRVKIITDENSALCNIEVPINLKEALENYKHALIDKAVEKSRGNNTEAARLLGMKNMTLWNWRQKRGY